MISTIEAKHVITQGIHVKAADLLILESSTIREIRAAYTQARNEIVQQLRTSWNEYNSGKTFLSPKELKLAGTKLLRDQQLFDNLDARLTQLGGSIDGINGKAILDAAGIQNNFTQKEFEALCKFTGLDPRSFALINHAQAEIAMQQVNKGTKFINKIVQKDTLKAMRQQMRIGVLKGESIDDITARLVSNTPLTLEGVNKGVFRTIEQRARLNARWGVIESANASAEMQYGSFNKRVDDADLKEMKVKKQVIAQIDNRTSVTCIYANGQIQPIGKPFETDQGLLDYPPFHPNCFDDKTEVLTNEGWKLFKDVDGKEKILSVNLKNGRSEWVKIKNKIEYKFKGELTSYTSRNCDLMVTPNHNQVVMFREKQKGRKDANEWKLVTEADLPNNDFKFLGTIPNYKGKDNEEIKIGDIKYKTKDFVEFMGYYLSEGSIDKYTKNRYRIKISQNAGEKKIKMLGNAKKIFKKIWISKESFQIPLENEQLAKYLCKLGKSYEKHIPENIKELDKEYLKIFLDAYLLGDGHIKRGKLWKDYQFKDMREYFTSSDRMAADIGELILKIGHRPSYYFPKDNKPVKHKNGIYLSKHLCWVIRENTTTTPDKQHLHKKTVDYNGIVYDVELLKYHTLFVRRNGKVLLSGNCRTTVGAWHQAFEAYGKNTQEMLKESQKEAKKRAKELVKKNKGKKFTKKQLAKQKATAKAGTKAIKATANTAPPITRIPTAEIAKQLKGLEPKDVVQILNIPTNTRRKKALKKYK